MNGSHSIVSQVIGRSTSGVRNIPPPSSQMWVTSLPCKTEYTRVCKYTRYTHTHTLLHTCIHTDAHTCIHIHTKAQFVLSKHGMYALCTMFAPLDLLPKVYSSPVVGLGGSSLGKIEMKQLWQNQEKHYNTNNTSIHVLF